MYHMALTRMSSIINSASCDKTTTQVNILVETIASIIRIVETAGIRFR